MRLTILPSDISFEKVRIPGSKLDAHGQCENMFTVSCKLPWGIVESRSVSQGTAMLALWESVRRDCDGRGIELIWRAVSSRTLVLRGEILQVLRNDGGTPMMADIVILEKPAQASIPVEKIVKLGTNPYNRLTGNVSESHYRHSSFAVHLPYSELPNPEGTSYFKDKPKVGDRYILEFNVTFEPCSACGSMSVKGQPVLSIDKHQVGSVWMLHYIAASYNGQLVNSNEIMESLERLDLGRSASVQIKELDDEAEVRRISSGQRLLRSADGRYLPLPGEGVSD